MSIITDPHGVPRLDIISARGVRFMILADPKAGLVEFWDARHHGMHFSLDIAMPGQFTGGRYTIVALLGETRPLVYSQGSELHVDLGVPDWCIDGAAMVVVRAWLRHLRMRYATVEAPVSLAQESF